MTKISLSSYPEYLVYILSNKGEETLVGMSGGEKFLFEKGKKKFTRLIYFEKFHDRTKAFRKKKYFERLDNGERLKLVKNKNPELLNLIFTIYDQ